MKVSIDGYYKELGRNDLIKSTNQFRSEDIFNSDETGLY